MRNHKARSGRRVGKPSSDRQALCGSARIVILVNHLTRQARAAVG
jgi:hypothetical protein